MVFEDAEDEKVEREEMEDSEGFKRSQRPPAILDPSF